MLRTIPSVLAALFLVPFAAFAQIDYPKDAFRDLRRGLEGTWFMPTDRGDKLEIWEITDDSTLAGKSIRIKPENGDTVILERLRLELRDTTVTFFTISRGQNNTTIPYKLTEIDDQGFYVFTSPTNEDPQKVKYLLLGNREVQEVREGRRNGRTVTDEFVFEREFNPGAIEFRVKGGINAQNLRGTGNFNLDFPGGSPEFGWKPGWELGTQVRFKGRGGFITVNVEVGLAGRLAHAKSAMTVIDDTTITYYKRDLTYNTVWLGVGLYPEISFSRDGRFSLMAGPYYARLVSARGKGLEAPANENKLFKANNDFKKNDFGLQAGFQYRLNFGKKDLGGILGLRVNLGLSNIDNLYKRYCDVGNSSLCNAAVGFQGATLYYSVDLLKL